MRLQVRDDGRTGSAMPRRRTTPGSRAFAGENVVDQDIVLVFDDGSPSRTLAVSARRLPVARRRTACSQAVVIYHDVTADRAQRSALESFAGVVAHDLLGPAQRHRRAGPRCSPATSTRRRLADPDEAAPKLERIRAAAAGHAPADRGPARVLDLARPAAARQPWSTSTRWPARSPSSAPSSTDRAAPRDRGRRRCPDVYADGALVRQLLDNLIGNAVKYVVPGEVARVSRHRPARSVTGSR